MTALLRTPPRDVTVGQPQAARGDGPRWAARHLAVCVVFFALCLNSSSGRVTPDTKIDLVTDPGRFLGRALTLWDPQSFAGNLQNQAYGYLFPMGPFFWVNHLLGVPGWVAQRLWWTLLLSVAYLGVVRLARALTIGTPVTRLAAGIAYACSPHVLTLLGANSVESLPMCVAPWVVLALVHGSSGGAGSSPRRAGLLCGVAILCMGGVNAAADAAAVLPAALFLLTRRRERATFVLAGWAVVGGLLATLWWLVPLVLLGRYSPPFLDYIENGATTSSVTSLVETLRGTADWVAYLPTSGWHAGYVLLSEPVVIVETVVVVAAGLAGLAATRSPHRGWLLACLGAGLVAVTFGHVGAIGSLFAGSERDLLDTVLAPVRNVHKFDVLIRLPLVLAVADLLPRLAAGRTALDRRRATVLVRAVTAVVIAGAAAPLVGLGLAHSASYDEIPGYWRQTASWLATHSGQGRALLAPASATPDYVWGTPTDEPLQPLARSAWEVRNNNPYSVAGHVRVLDTVDDLLGTGVAQPRLASYLARTGVRFLVVRNDLDYRASGSVAPATVQATLAASPGLRRVQGFGPQLGGPGSYAFSVDQGLQPSQRAVDVWQVTGTGDPRVTSTGTLSRVSGGPESLAQLDGAAPTALSGTATGGARTGQVVLTDGMRRREVNYGATSGQHSVTLAAGQDGPIGRRVPDFVPVAGTQHQSVVRYLGARGVSASTSAADATGFVATQPDEQPWSAFDGDGATSWRSAPGVAAAGQWVQLRLARETATAPVTVRVPPGITGVAVRTSAGTREATVGLSGVVTIRPAGARTTSVRVTVTSTARDYVGPAAITDVRMPGVAVARTVVAPRDVPADRPVDVVSFATPGDARTGCLLVRETPLCVAGRARGSEDGAGLDRTFTLTREASYDPAITVQPRAGDALTALLSRVAGYGVGVTASSEAVPDPLAGGQAAFDADGTTGWVARADDRDPTLTLDFGRPVSLDRIAVVTSADLPATRPDSVRITSTAGSRSGKIAENGTVRFSRLRTSAITLHLRSFIGLRPVAVTSIAGQSAVGVGLSELVIPGVAATSRLETRARPVSLPCGAGPDVTVDGQRRTTRVTTTVGALRNLSPIVATLCDTAPLDLAAGTHRLVVSGPGVWTTPTATLTRTGQAAAASAAPAVRVASWGRTDRTARVAARAASAVVIVNENVNAGWTATFDGTPLRTVTVDGWRQGYVVPAGEAGTLHLAYTPQRTYAAALVGGAVTVALLVLAVLLLRRRRYPATVIAPARPPRWAGLAAGGMVGLLVGGVTGLAVVAVTAAALLLAGRMLRDVAWVAVLPAALAATAYGLAGLVLSVRHLGTFEYAANTVLLQVLCLVAVGAVFTTVRRQR